MDIVTSGILAMFSMFAQLIQYFSSAPGNALYTIFSNWGRSFEGYGIAIPIVFVLILGLTGAVAYTLIEMAKTMSDAMDVGGMAGAGGSMEMVAFLVSMHSISLDEASYIFGSLGNAIVNGL
ncbi:MAG: hypothetical protein ACP5L4_07350, partial [Thermoplasmata archaeon]